MKTAIHPQLYQTKISCACGAHYVIPGTVQELHTDICMACHPHYTGKKKLLDTEGRVDKFMSKFKGVKGAVETEEKPKKAEKTEKLERSESEEVGENEKVEKAEKAEPKKTSSPVKKKKA